MIKVHVYHGKNNGKSATIRSETLGLTILRQSSVKDANPLQRPKGSQLVMLSISEVNGELFIRNIRTDERIRIDNPPWPDWT